MILYVLTYNTNNTHSFSIIGKTKQAHRRGSSPEVFRKWIQMCPHKVNIDWLFTHLLTSNEPATTHMHRAHKWFVYRTPIWLLFPTTHKTSLKHHHCRSPDHSESIAMRQRTYFLLPFNEKQIAQICAVIIRTLRDLCYNEHSTDLHDEIDGCAYDGHSIGAQSRRSLCAQITYGYPHK